MKKVVVLMILVVSFVVTASAQAAFQGGGKAPSEAPTIAWGQHYLAEMDNHAENANYGGDYEVAFWRLPPVSSRDELVVNWHSVPETRNAGYFPICMALVQGVNDSSWGEAFQHNQGCESEGHFKLSGSGTAASKVTVQENDSSGNSYLEFWMWADESSSSTEQENFPYDFTVEAPRHYLNMTISPFTEVPANGIVSATVTDATGAPAPDGLTFGLTVRWTNGGIASYSAPSSGGRVSFQLALPESAYKKDASFVAGRGADGEFQAVETPVLRAKVTEPPPPPAPPVIKKPLHRACKKANSRVRVIGRLYHRTAAHWHRARRTERLRLHRRARTLHAKLHRAKARAKLACA